MTYLFTLAVLASVAVALAVSLNVASGYSRALSLAHAAFWGLGAYGYALTVRADGSPFAGLMVAAMAGAVGGVLVGLPTLRLREDYFLIATLGLGEVVNASMVNLRGWTGGSNGLSGITALPWVRDGAAYAVVFCAFAALVLVAARMVEQSAFGQVLRAVAEDEEAAASLARNPAAVRLKAVVLGATIAGLTGGLYASWASFISPALFGTTTSLGVLAMVLLGGIGHVWGAVSGAAVLTLLPELLRFSGLSGPGAQMLQQLAYGVALVAMMAVRPGGLLPARLGR